MLRRAFGVGPADLDIGGACVTEAEVQRHVAVGTEVAVPTVDLLRLDASLGLHAHAGTDRGRIAAAGPLQVELKPVGVLPEDVLEEPDLGRLIAIVGRVGVAPESRVPDDDVEIAISIEVGDGGAMAAVVREEVGGIDRGGSFRIEASYNQSRDESGPLRLTESR